MDQIFEIQGTTDYFVTDLLQPGNYDRVNDRVLGFWYDKSGTPLHHSKLAYFYNSLRPVQKIPEWFFKLGEVVKTTITSLQNESQTFVIYKDGGVKIFEQNALESVSNVTYLYSEDMQQINAAINE